MSRLATKVADLESDLTQPSTLEAAKLLHTKLVTLDDDFKVHHFAIVDQTAELLMGDQQDVLDQHDDEVAQLTVRIQQVITSCSVLDGNPRKVSSKRLTHIQKVLATITSGLSSLPDAPDDVVLLHQYEEQLVESKTELGEIRNQLYTLDLEDSDDLNALQATIEQEVFDRSLDVKKHLLSRATAIPVPPAAPSAAKGVRLPKIDVPTFDGNLLHWNQFWEQFDVAVHSKSSLSNAEKLVYLQHALKEGSAKQTIEGLSRSGNQYDEAVECLKDRFNRPRLIHQAHVRMIIDAPSLKDGTGKELRRLHDVAQQHLRALKSLGHEPPGSFITSLLELKLDTTTTFEWQRHSQASPSIPHYDDLLKFLNLRAQASESVTSESSRKSGRQEVHPPKRHSSGKQAASFTANVDVSINCVMCKSEKHPLYACAKFKALNHDDMLSTVRSNGLCINCLRPGHYSKDCSSTYRCKHCQKPHHSLLHVEPRKDASPIGSDSTSVSNHVAMSLKSDMLLMTCNVLVESPNGSVSECRALLDSGSTVSFISERLAQRLRLPRRNHPTRLSGVAGLACGSTSRSIANFKISSACSSSPKFDVTAMVVSCVTCDLPLHPIPSNTGWEHLSGIKLADPTFGTPGRIDLLLGVETFVEVLGHGRRIGAPGTPTAFETQFGWVLAGNTNVQTPVHHVVTHHVASLTGDDLIRRFWETEESPGSICSLTLEERNVMDHFKKNHAHLPDGRFVVPLPRNARAGPLGESRAQAVRRFLSFERTLHAKNQFQEVETVMKEYFDSGHAEEVPLVDFHKQPQDVFYLPMHCVRKESSTTSKIRAVFDASAKTSTGVALNDTLLVGPTVHSSLVDVLLRFRQHRVALTADVSRMYRAIALIDSDKDLHRFVWRTSPQDPLKDYRMTRVTFGVSASSFIANMCVKQNALDHASEFPRAAKAVDDAFYVDDGITGADSVPEAVELHHQLQALFAKAGLLLRKWNSSEPMVLEQIDSELLDAHSILTIADPDSQYTKTLGIEWNASQDHFRLTVAALQPLQEVTKRRLVSDIAKTFDVLGWFSPTIVTVKILLQRLWEEKIPWDDPVPEAIHQVWSQWRDELQLLSSHHLPRCYFPKEVKIISMELHGFSDASQLAYAGVVYVRMIDDHGGIHVSLVTAKTKVAPIKRLTIPRLELCGAHLLSQLLHHCKVVFQLPPDKVFAWTDSTIVLNWLVGSPRRFNVYVGNRVSHIVELIAPDRWGHVEGTQNPADCASRGLLPSELIEHTLWWTGPDWLRCDASVWPKQPQLSPNTPSEEGDEICHHVVLSVADPIIPVDRYSSFARLKRITAWVFRFVNNCKARRKSIDLVSSPLIPDELRRAEHYWIGLSQRQHFSREIATLKANGNIPVYSPLLSLTPFVDDHDLLRVGGREGYSKRSYDCQHPLIVHAKHPIATLIVRSEHLRLLHAGPLLVTTSLSRRFHLIKGRNLIRSVTRGCITCRRSQRPRPQMMGQLPAERVTPDSVFDKVGVDYAGPVYTKIGAVRKPTVVKSYIAVFVSLSVKAVHLELVSSLTTDAFIACLRRFVSRRGKPRLIWSDHGTNFVGAARSLVELHRFLRRQETEEAVTSFCATEGITWDFIPERAPHFGGLWEAAVKSTKRHLGRVVGNAKLSFEELTTVLCQIEACLNSRPLTPLPSDGDNIEVLTPGHFLIGRPLEAIPDSTTLDQPITSLRRWHLCQSLVKHFWQRWSTEYLVTLQKVHKWRRPVRNFEVGDVVVLREDTLAPTHWPLARVVKTYLGGDGLVRVVTVKTNAGTYTRPVSKVALLLPTES